MALRCFIAIEFSDEIRKSIWQATAPMRAVEADVKWVEESNYHLTLKFLGSVDEELIPRIKATLEEIATKHTAFEITIRGAGVFPDARRPRVVWVGIESAQGLGLIARDIEAGMIQYGFAPEDRSFSPHLTVGRVKSLRGSGDVMRALHALGQVSFGVQAVRSIAIMKSDLTPHGPIYGRLHEIILPLNNSVSFSK